MRKPRRYGQRLLLIALISAAGCTAGVGAAPASISPTVPPTTTAPGPLPRSVLTDVEAAYRRAWAVYAAAVGRVEPGRLDTAFAASALTLKEREVARLARDGHAIRVDIDHHLEIALIDAETAVVTDFLRNHMVLVDARTRQPLEPDPDEVLARAYTLRREGSTWKISEAVALG